MLWRAPAQEPYLTEQCECGRSGCQVNVNYIRCNLCYLRSQVQRDNVNRPKFIDLFCGIGGMRLAFESAGAECVFSSDWDKYAQQTYEANFGHSPAGNIREIPAADIPDHEILIAGFPCQPFSISGVSKKKSLGREHVFDGKENPTCQYYSDAIYSY
jgi:hypothetical protein